MKNSTKVLIVVSLVDLISDILFIFYLMNILNYHSEDEPKGYQDLVYGSYITSIFFLGFSFFFHFLLYRFSKEKKSFDFDYQFTKEPAYAFPECINMYAVHILKAVISPVVIFYYLLQSVVVGLKKLHEEKGHWSESIAFALSFGWGFWFSAYSGASASLRSMLSLILGIPHMIEITILYFLWWMIRTPLYIISSLLFFASTLTNSELLYFFHGEKEKRSYYLCTIGGMLVEDVPQFLIQLFFAVYAYQAYGKALNGIQWFSVAFTIWRFWSTLALKWMRYEKEVPEVVEGNPQGFQLVV
eukprot:gene12010-13116_t